jgi:lysine 2,3-aminomutase
MESLRGHTSGFSIPTFVVDAPGGGGKTPTMPNYTLSYGTNKVIMRNFEGVITTYTEPENYKHTCQCDVCTGKKKAELIGVASLLNNQRISLEPEGLERKKRGEAIKKAAKG